MSARKAWPWLVLWSALQGALGCSFDSSANDARGCDEGCAVCHLGFCLATSEDGVTASGGSGGTGATGGSGAGGAGMAGVSGSSGATGAVGGSAGDTGGEGGGGSGVTGGDGSSGVTGGDGSGGMTGGGPSCMPETEQCNGLDDDCDGDVDEGCACEPGETQACYGGRLLTRGVGPCKAGLQTCDGGQFGDCEGEVVPEDETCANPGVDDNCDGRLDNVPGRGLCFDFTKLGECFTGVAMCEGDELVCKTPAAAAFETECDGLDEDCNGEVDEAFAFASDEDNCGECGMRCGAGQLCCGGMCRSIDSDEAHCGGCNDACGAGLTCCGGDCTATDTDAHCGGCDVACAPNQDCCGGSCADVDTPARCGGCDTTCEDGQDCCGGSCTDLDTPQHCGSCTQGCMEGQGCCSGDCMPIDSNPNCGGCNIVCPEPCACMAGACRDAMGVDCI